MSKILLIDVILHFMFLILRHCYFKQLKSETTKMTFIYPVLVSLELGEIILEIKLHIFLF